MNRCFLIGGGPSLKDVDLSLVKKEFCIGINMAFRLGTFIDMWFFSDSDIFKNNKKEIEKWPNKIVSCAEAAKRHKKIKYYYRCREHAICYEPDKLAFPSKGANSGATAINLAIREGFDQIILLGYDMQVVDGLHNYHDHYTKQPPNDIYDRFLLPFKAIADELEDRYEVINANPNSRLDCFPKMELKDIL